ncbi:MAG: YitT family protein [Clostridia bacterium]|nr:YitT family protein [Clostridia bacterium]
MKKILNVALRYLIITLAALLLALATYILIIPNDFAPSGISGLCVMVQYLFGFSVGYLNIIINLPLCLLAFFMGYRRFAIRSYYFCITYSVLYIILQNIDPVFLQYNANGQDTVLPVLIAGVTSGMVTVICYENLGSQCGTDVISKILSEKKPEFNFFWASFVINSAVAVISLFVYSYKDGVFSLENLNYKPVALCVMFCLADSLIADVIWRNGREASEFVIITPEPQKVIDAVMAVTNHTGTLINGTGVYSKEEKAVLIFVVNKFQVTPIKRLLRTFPDTFSYVGTVNETIGDFNTAKVKKEGILKKIGDKK